MRTKLCDAGVSRCLTSRGPGALLRCLIGNGPCGGGGADAGFGVGWPLAVARVSSSSHSAWIWRCTAAGLNEVWMVASRRLGSAMTSGWAAMRAYEVVAVS